MSAYVLCNVTNMETHGKMTSRKTQVKSSQVKSSQLTFARPLTSKSLWSSPYGSSISIEINSSPKNPYVRKKITVSNGVASLMSFANARGNENTHTNRNVLVI